MSGIDLTTPIGRGSDTAADVVKVEINYVAKAVSVSLQFRPTGTFKRIVIQDADFAALRAAVPNFNGLRPALLSFLQTLDAALEGNVT